MIIYITVSCGHRKHNHFLSVVSTKINWEEKNPEFCNFLLEKSTEKHILGFHFFYILNPTICNLKYLYIFLVPEAINDS